MITRTMLTDQLDLYHARLEMALEGITDEEARRVMAKPLAPVVWQIRHLDDHAHNADRPTRLVSRASGDGAGGHHGRGGAQGHGQPSGAGRLADRTSR